MFRVICEARPAYVLCENVAGHITMGLDTVLSDLEGEGYTCQSFVIPAVAKDAKHRRDRIWIVGNSRDVANSNPGLSERENKEICTGGNTSDNGSQNVAYSKSIGWVEGEYEHGNPHEGSTTGRWGVSDSTFRNSESGGSARPLWLPEPSVGRVVDGLPNRMDRLKGLGNAIVPQVAYEIMRCLK